MLPPNPGDDLAPDTTRVAASNDTTPQFAAAGPLAAQGTVAKPSLIFLPGFSTADAVSDLSGLGVGMDVVKRNIADLGGQVQVFSTPQQRSLIRVRLPLTLAIVEGQMLRVGKETFEYLLTAAAA